MRAVKGKLVSRKRTLRNIHQFTAGADHRFGQILQHQAVRIVDPQLPVLPVARKTFAGKSLEVLPGAGNITSNPHCRTGSERRPHRGVAAENESSGSSPLRQSLHPAAERFDARQGTVMPDTKRKTAPDRRIQFEITAVPLTPHRPENRAEIIARGGNGGVEHIPGSASPAAERAAVGTQRRTGLIHHKPVRMFPEQLRILLRYERRDPDRRLQPELRNSAAERRDARRKVRMRNQPVPHMRLITVVDLNKTQFGEFCFHQSGAAENIGLRNLRAVAVP